VPPTEATSLRATPALEACTRKRAEAAEEVESVLPAPAVAAADRVNAERIAAEISLSFIEYSPTSPFYDSADAAYYTETSMRLRSIETHRSGPGV
jgi:hypothetical protein